jgi:hypothetical protein
MRIIHQLSESRWQEVHSYIKTNLLPLAQQEKAQCAKGRYNLWLNAEPNYATRKYHRAITDDRLWSFIQKITDSSMTLAQIYFAIEGKGIDWHRDAAYCNSNAYIVNLGKVRLETKLPSQEIISFDLSGGEVINFNAKFSHRAIPFDHDRIGIGVWSDKISLSDPKNWH